MDAVFGTLKDAIGSVLDEARKVPPMPNTNTQHIVVHQAEAPKPEPKMAWLSATAAVVGVLVGLVAAGVAWDAKDEVRALRLEVATRLEGAQNRHENDTRELRQKDAAFQAYIVTGKVPVKSEPQSTSKK